jgi:hypothetical protein
MYEPKVNDYVKWKNNIEGWIYFVDENYVTIEIQVISNSRENYVHRNDRTLVLCYRNQWQDLIYVKTRSHSPQIKKNKFFWRYFAKALGEKASKCDKESDIVASIRAFIFITYLITNLFIIAGVIRHWNKNEVPSYIHQEKKETQIHFL